MRNVRLKENIETGYKRLLRLEEQATAEGFQLTEQRIRLPEKADPEFAERHVESGYPGYLLCQDTFYVGRLEGAGRSYLRAIVDTCGSFAFGKLYTGKRRETAADILNDRVLPFYESHDLTVKAVLTDNGTEYKGRPVIHMYEIFLELNDIEHRTTRVATPRTDGFAERFNRTVPDEFFRTAFRKKLYESVDALRIDLDEWLHRYNYERTHRGYRNQRRRPIETFEMGGARKPEILKEAA